MLVISPCGLDHCTIIDTGESNHNVDRKEDISNKIIFSVDNNHCGRSHKRCYN
uniref:Uncharacterized protein n=1 Tax=Arundo donax TaxID=35708 RepID=A0A0A9E099_ARUDO